MKKSLGKAPPTRQASEFSHAFLRSPALGVREIPQPSHMVGMKVGEKHVFHMTSVDLCGSFLRRMNLHSRKVRIDGIGEVGRGVMESRGVTRVEKNGAFLRVNQLGPGRKKPDVFSRSAFHRMVGFCPTQTGISEVQFNLGHDCGGVYQLRNS